MAQLYEVKDLHDDCLKYYAKLSKVDSCCDVTTFCSDRLHMAKNLCDVTTPPLWKGASY